VMKANSDIFWVEMGSIMVPVRIGDSRRRSECCRPSSYSRSLIEQADKYFWGPDYTPSHCGIL
jgi:hypothetical protein